MKTDETFLAPSHGRVDEVRKLQLLVKAHEDRREGEQQYIPETISREK